MNLIVKKSMVSDKALSKNDRTALEFIISNSRTFKDEKSQLVVTIVKTEQNGVAFYDGKENPALSDLSSQEWSNLFEKHLDHYLSQFGAY